MCTYTNICNSVLTMHLPGLTEVCELFFSNTNFFVSSKKKMLELELPQYYRNVHIIHEQLLMGVHVWYLGFPENLLLKCILNKKRLQNSLITRSNSTDLHTLQKYLFIHYILFVHNVSLTLTIYENK